MSDASVQDRLGQPVAPEPEAPSEPARPAGTPVQYKPVDSRPETGTRRAHLIGYAHLDPVWLWQWMEGYAEARATLRSAVDRLNESADFVYTSTSIVFLEWVQESDPELFAEIAHHVATDRFHLSGGWWVEPDCNLPSGESFVRQALYGQRFCAEQFGVVATVGGNPDSFGHAATLPQLLAKAGLSGYFFTRPAPEELTLPGDAFLWKGPDGTEIPAYRAFGYSSDRHAVEDRLRRCLEVAGDDRDVMVFYGVGNHGGGPTKANLASIRRLGATQPYDVLYSTPRAALDFLMEEPLPVHEGELQHHARGCYSSHAEIKRLNRRAEEVLPEAEAWATIAHTLTGFPYPGADLARAWKMLLLNQFHDTLAGTAIESAYDDARHQLGEALSTAQRITNAAAQRLCTRIAIPAEDDMQPIVVFNPHPWPVREVVEAEVGGWARRTNLVDDGGLPVPLQWGESEATMPSGRYRAVFPVDVPPLGYRLYRLCMGTGAFQAPTAPPAGRLENERLLVEIDERTGGIARLVHKPSGLDLAGSGDHAVVLVDDSDTWGHGHDRWDDEEAVFTVDALELVEHGPVRSVVRVRSHAGTSTLVEDYVLGADDDFVEVRVTLDWRERGRMLKLRYPTAVTEPTVRASAAYGSVERHADGCEEVMQGWLDVSGSVEGRSAGLTLANDGKYSYDVRTVDGSGDIGVTVARSVVYAHHDPAVRREGVAYRWLDLGEQRFRFRLLPHLGDWRGADPARAAAVLNRPLLWLRDTYHDGPLDPSGTFVTVDGEGVLGTVLKRAEEGAASIVRLVETWGRETTATVDLSFLGRRFTHTLRPFDVVTLRVPDDAEEPVLEVDLTEWAEGERPPGQFGNAVSPSPPS